MCNNRLVQHGLQVRLQLFKTQNKGWGIRCLDDVAKGSFVCIYAGMEQMWILLLFMLLPNMSNGSSVIKDLSSNPWTVRDKLLHLHTL